MDNILICEGSTDYFLLQYYMREAYQWNDDSSQQGNILKLPGQKSRKLVKGINTLTIMSSGGCSRLAEGLESALDRNRLSQPDLSGSYGKIVIITDRDDINTEADFIVSIEGILNDFGIIYKADLINNLWIPCEMINAIGKKIEFQLLLLVIPFEEKGAMETFLLKAISENDIYDEKIIAECGNLVDNIDPEKRYLTGRRIITKAKFDTYFSIRTPAEQFVERQNILKSVKWEQYTKIQKDFKLLEDL